MAEFVPAEPTGRLVGKVAIVTGSSAGIENLGVSVTSATRKDRNQKENGGCGHPEVPRVAPLGEAIAVRLAQEGASITLTGRDMARLEAVEKKCKEAAEKSRKTTGETTLLIVGDLTSSEVRNNLVDKTLKTFGRLDILVNNAGMFSGIDGLDKITEEKYDELFSVNVKAGFFLTKLAAVHLEKTNGNVLFTSSCLSQVPMVNGLVYCATKSAVDNLVRNLAVVLAPRGVRVNSVNPSYIATMASREFAPDSSTDSVIQAGKAAEGHFNKLHPLGRCAKPEEIAEAALFMVSPQAVYVTGENFSVDGGARLPGIFTQ